MANDDQIVKLQDGPCAGYMYAIVGKMPDLGESLYVMESDGGVICYFEYKVTQLMKSGMRLGQLSRELLGSEFKRLQTNIDIAKDSGTRLLPIYRATEPEGQSGG